MTENIHRREFWFQCQLKKALSGFDSNYEPCFTDSGYGFVFVIELLVS